MLSTPHPPHPTLGFWIRLFWLLNPWLLKIVVVESGVLVVESGFAGCWSLGCWIVWLLKPAFLVAEAMVAESGCFGCWIRRFWLLNPALLVAEALVVECFGCWFRLCWLLKLWLSNPSLWLLNPAFWLLNLSCWIRVGCWIRFCSVIHQYQQPNMTWIHSHSAWRMAGTRWYTKRPLRPVNLKFSSESAYKVFSNFLTDSFSFSPQNGFVPRTQNCGLCQTQICMWRNTTPPPESPYTKLLPLP